MFAVKKIVKYSNEMISQMMIYIDNDEYKLYMSNDILIVLHRILRKQCYTSRE